MAGDIADIDHDALAFLAGEGEMARLIRAHDWSPTLGPPAAWPPCLKTTVGLMIRAPVPIVLLWGEDGVMIYNDAYSVFAGDRHPELLGSKVREGWSEVADFNDNVMRVGLAGETLAYRDQELTLHRRGAPEQVWMNLDYWPVPHEDGRPAGVIAFVVETTERVHAERRQAALTTLTERLGRLDDPTDIAFAAAEVLGEALRVRRVGYATVDLETETLQVDRDWTAPGVEHQPGPLKLRDYGSFVESLKAGEAVDIHDVLADPRTRDAVPALQARGTRAFISVPILERGRLVAVLFITDAIVRCWAAEDLALVHEVAARTRTAVERVRAVVALREANETLEQRVATALAERRLLAELVDTTDTLIQALDHDYRFLAINPANAGEYERIYGVRPAVGDSLLDLLADRPDLLAAGKAVWARAFAGESFTLVSAFGDPSVEVRSYEIKARPLIGPDGRQIGAYQFSTDVTERLREQARLAEAEAALFQSQKMEAVGQLTGGLAHDFNNLLTGVSGSLELLERRIGQGRFNGLDRYISAAQGAARRAAALTQRLLAFSRRQTLDPRPTDLNRLVAGMEELIRRTVGPVVQVEVVGAGGLWLTKVDPPQLENALLNLCLNGRDAMAPNGGRLTIETANTWLDPHAAADRELPPGQYVTLCVSDTGVGMSAEVVARAFDPFFTTKPLGEGTGLGLSMVYGFVRQSGGQVRIYTEPGSGTTMRLYLPRHVGALDAPDAADRTGGIEPGDGETILLVDDEPTVRMLAAEVLEENGYRVVEAGDGSAGLRILESDARIDLLITDVGLPGGMNGRQVADAARVLRPALKVLFITGYAENAVVGNGHLEPGMEILTKPFAMSALAMRIRDLLDR